MEPHVKKVPLHLQSSQNRILIKGGTVVNEDATFRADVYIEDRWGKGQGTLSLSISTADLLVLTG